MFGVFLPFILTVRVRHDLSSPSLSLSVAAGWARHRLNNTEYSPPILQLPQARWWFLHFTCRDLWSLIGTGSYNHDLVFHSSAGGKGCITVLVRIGWWQWGSLKTIFSWERKNHNNIGLWPHITYLWQLKNSLFLLKNVKDKRIENKTWHYLV